MGKSFERFMNEYTAGERVGGAALRRKNVPEFDELMQRCAGASFSHGVYRLHHESSAAAANEAVSHYFPEFAERRRVDCFGFDWLGRQFGLDSARQQNGEPLVLMFEPGTGEVLEIPAGFSSFHNVEMVQFADAAIARNFFEEWLSRRGGEPLRFDQCAGYKVPLFLNGDDTVGNLELIDIDVYWKICAELRHGTKDLPDGAVIHQLKID